MGFVRPQPAAATATTRQWLEQRRLLRCTPATPDSAAALWRRLRPRSSEQRALPPEQLRHVPQLLISHEQPNALAHSRCPRSRLRSTTRWGRPAKWGLLNKASPAASNRVRLLTVLAASRQLLISCSRFWPGWLSCSSITPMKTTQDCPHPSPHPPLRQRWPMPEQTPNTAGRATAVVGHHR